MVQYCTFSLIAKVTFFLVELIFILIWLLQTCLISPTSEQYDLLQCKLKERIENGRGETIFEVGVGEGTVLAVNLNNHDINYLIFLHFYLCVS